MNENERYLLRHVCDGNMERAQSQARVILEGIKTQKDESFRNHMLEKLDAKKAKIVELPSNIKGLIIAENVSDFPVERFLIREAEEKIVTDTLNLYHVAEQLKDLSIPYLPALMLHGQSGCGKTMLARYIAYKTNLPFVYVNFSNLVGQYLGNTQSNIGRIFDYVREHPCVLCFDEIDAVGMARGQKNDVGEMNRIVIALMQEMDRLPNNLIIIGTTNRYDRLDPALIRRFSIEHEVRPLTVEEAKTLARSFLASVNINRNWFEDWFEDWFEKTFCHIVPASDLIREATKMVVQAIIAQREGFEKNEE